MHAKVCKTSTIWMSTLIQLAVSCSYHISTFISFCLQVTVDTCTLLRTYLFLCFHKMGCSRKYLYPPMGEINNRPPLFMDILYKFKTFFVRFPSPSPSLDRRNLLCVWDKVLFWNDPINISCNSKYMTIIIQITNGQIGSFCKC